MSRWSRADQKLGVKGFYDNHGTVNLWGKDLAGHLDNYLSKASRYCLMFISEAYAAKP